MATPHSEYRLFLEHANDSPENQTVLFWYKKHPISQIGSGITFAKHKVDLIEEASRATNLRFQCNEENVDSQESSENEDFFTGLPKELLLSTLLPKLDVGALCCLAQVCSITRNICLDDFIWKRLCYFTWVNPVFLRIDLNANLNRICQARSMTGLDKETIQSLYEDNIWRLTYIAMYKLERMPSVAHISAVAAPFFPGRTAECFGTPRSIQFRTSKGQFMLKGVRQVSCVEFIVYNYDMKCWYRKEYKKILPWDTKHVLDQVGLRLVRSRRGAGRLRRRGVFLYNDTGVRINTNRYYLPSIRFRIYKLDDRVLLLCHDYDCHHGQYTDIYSMYELQNITPHDPVVPPDSCSSRSDTSPTSSENNMILD